MTARNLPVTEIDGLVPRQKAVSCHVLRGVASCPVGAGRAARQLKRLAPLAAAVAVARKGDGEKGIWLGGRG